MRTAETIPSTPVRVMKCCMFGVNLNGTDSEDDMIGLFEDVAIADVSRDLNILEMRTRTR